MFQTCTHYVTIGFKVWYVGKEIIYKWMKNEVQSDKTHIFRKDGFFSFFWKNVFSILIHNFSNIPV